MSLGIEHRAKLIELHEKGGSLNCQPGSLTPTLEQLRDLGYVHISNSPTIKSGGRGWKQVSLSGIGEDYAERVVGGEFY